MFVIGLWLAKLALASCGHADEITIFDMRKSLSLSNDEKSYRDFYINKGNESGLKVGMVITVTRKVPMYDSYQNRSAGDLLVEVGKIKIIQVQKGLAVAREFESISRENTPMLEDYYLMVGDQLDLGSAHMEKKPKTAQASPEKPETVARAPESTVDFASKASDKEAMERPVEGPVLQ